MHRHLLQQQTGGQRSTGRLNYITIAWLRVDTQTILTIQNHVITKNHRMSITHAEKRAWVLRIRDVKESDKGWYMCQINTDPMKSQVGYLDVVEKNPLDNLRSDNQQLYQNPNIVQKIRDKQVICYVQQKYSPQIQLEIEDLVVKPIWLIDDDAKLLNTET
uniref:Ig-like domain-containing protein n=1 Tax=Megaselia scalaris TaxID=36166 RepID=T1GFV6_MEGSC